jgi:hypothetical protein
MQSPTRVLIIIAFVLGIATVALNYSPWLYAYSDSVSEDPVLVGAGDIASCKWTRDSATADLLDTIAGTVANLGDSVYEDGTLQEFADCYEPAWGRHKARTMPSAGNHDYNTDGAEGYYTYFGAAASPLDNQCTKDCKGYYSYELGTWHIIVLNSEIDVSAGSAQEQWLRADLAAHGNVCTLAYWHRPRYSSGKHGNNEIMTPFWDALYEHGADVVLSGHDTLYERFAPQNATGEAEPGRGIRQFVVGTGGDNLNGVVSVEANSEVREGSTWGVIKLTLHPTSYDWKFIPIAGQTFQDSGSENCVTFGSSPPVATPMPTVTATATASTTITTATTTPSPTLIGTPDLAATPTATADATSTAIAPQGTEVAATPHPIQLYLPNINE